MLSKLFLFAVQFQDKSPTYFEVGTSKNKFLNIFSFGGRWKMPRKSLKVLISKNSLSRGQKWPSFPQFRISSVFSYLTGDRINCTTFNDGHDFGFSMISWLTRTIWTSNQIKYWYRNYLICCIDSDFYPHFHCLFTKTQSVPLDVSF